MARVRIFSTAVACCFACASIASAQLDDHIWIGGTGTQQWQLNSNWFLNGDETDAFPNDPGRVDSNAAVISNVEGANLSVNLAANLNLNVGATDATIAALTIGGTAGAVATNITSTGGRLVFENFESNNTTPEPDECAFNCGRAMITSQGVIGSTNTITAVVGVNDHIDVVGPTNLTLAGGLQEMAGSAGTGDVSLRSITVGSTVFITGNITTLDLPQGTNQEDVPLGINSSIDSQGTVDISGTISGAGRMRYGTPANSGVLYPQGTVIVRGNNTEYSGRTIIGRGNLVLAHDNALGTSDVKEEGASGIGQTGYNILSTEDSRTIENVRIIGQWMTIKGEHSLTWNGMAYQDNTGGWINMLPAGKTFTIGGPQYPNHTEELGSFPVTGRYLSFDGPGKTLITGGLHSEYDNPEDPMGPLGALGNYTFQGTGTYVISGGSSTYNGITEIRGANVHFDTNADFGNTLEFRSTGGAVGVDAGVISNSSFHAELNNSSNLVADAAGNLVLYDHGGLMLAASEYDSNLDFTTGTLANAGDMSLAAHEAGSLVGHTYRGSITPRNNTYRFGGGSGTLTLPGLGGGALPNQLTGARSVLITNGGEVSITNTNNYTGATRIIAKFMESLEAGAAADSLDNVVDGDNIPNDQKFVGTTLTVTSLANGGSVSSIGSSTNVAANLFIHGSTLKYVGAGATTNRLFTIGTGGATIDSSGSGALNFNNTSALGIDIAEPRTGNVNSFATGNTTSDRTVVRNLTSTEDLVPGMPIMSPGLGADGIPEGTTITRVVSSSEVQLSQPAGEFAFFLDTPITFGAAPERPLSLTGSNSGNNTLASLIGNASDGGVVGLTKNGTGKWIVTGNNTYTGATNVNAGTLLINGTQTGTGLTTVAAGATLGGIGRVGGALTNNGIINPGESVGTLNVNGDVTMAADSHFAVELLGTSADRLAITGNLDLTALGNSLDVIDLGKSGTSWIIATYTGTLTGTFENISPGYSVDYGTLSNSQITLNFVSDPGLLGDFNDDGVVDAADYVKFRKNEGTNNALPNDSGIGTPIGPAHLSLWRANFGASAGSGGSSAAAGAIPEPTTALLACMIGVALAAGQRRRRK